MTAMRPQDRSTPSEWYAARRAAHSRAPRNADALDFLRQILTGPKPPVLKRSRYQRRYFWGNLDPLETGRIPFNDGVLA